MCIALSQRSSFLNFHVVINCLTKAPVGRDGIEMHDLVGLHLHLAQDVEQIHHLKQT